MAIIILNYCVILLTVIDRNLLKEECKRMRTNILKGRGLYTFQHSVYLFFNNLFSHLNTSDGPHFYNLFILK